MKVAIFHASDSTELPIVQQTANSVTERHAWTILPTLRVKYQEDGRGALPSEMPQVGGPSDTQELGTDPRLDDLHLNHTTAS